MIQAEQNHQDGPEYWGLDVICERMGWRDPRRPVRQALRDGFPLYVRKKRFGAKDMYYSSEKLIRAWEWTRAQREMERLKTLPPLESMASMQHNPFQMTDFE
mgnify:FL=1